MDIFLDTTHEILLVFCMMVEDNMMHNLSTVP